jgi:hypothetical protein
MNNPYGMPKNPAEAISSSLYTKSLARVANESWLYAAEKPSVKAKVCG